MYIKIVELNGPKQSSKGKFQDIEVTYTDKNDTQKTKSVVSFGDGKGVYDSLAAGNFGPGDEVEVEVVKVGQFWNWIGLAPATSKPPAWNGGARSASGTTKPGVEVKKGDWETSEDRYKKNLAICRQNALTAAVNYSSEVGEQDHNPRAILEVAQLFFEWTTQDFIKEVEVAKQLTKAPSEFK